MFHFKKFSLDDSLSAMKTGTDSVLLAAWTDVEGVHSVLDIGTGSGLIALMMAQRIAEATVDAVEIEKTAAQQAVDNISMSPWHDRIHVFNDSIQHYSTATSRRYDLIISNPPFFSKSLPPPLHSRQIARHDGRLPVANLMECVNLLMAPEGTATLILPAQSEQAWLQNASLYGLFASRITRVKSKSGHKAHRTMLQLTRKRQEIPYSDEITIYAEDSGYTDTYKHLTGEFYLKF